MDTTYQTTDKQSSIKTLLDDVTYMAISLGNMMYGSQKRTWITLAVAFGMLVAGISMMQVTGEGGACVTPMS